MLKHVLLALTLLCPAASSAAPAGGPWISAYYTGWRQSHMPPAQIDFDAFTHLIHFAVVPRTDGSLDADVNMLTPANVKATVAAAKAARKKILFTVGGQASRERFISAMKRREAFIENLVRFMRRNGYDGIDLDMEHMTPADARDYVRFTRELRARLDRISPRPLLTAAALWEPSRFAALAPHLDQINLMTYNLAGPYPGWVAWHSGAIRDGGRTFPNGKRLPSADALVDTFTAAGVPKRKLGVGISFNGYVWSGGNVSRPGETWSEGAAPEMKSFPYYALAARYGLREHDPASPGYAWDAQAEAAYLSVPGESPGDAAFVSYHNETSAARMLDYVRTKGLGGMILWDIAAGWRPDLPEGRRDPLLKAVKAAARRADDSRTAAAGSGAAGEL